MFDAYLSHRTSTPVTFSWATGDGTATAPSDYVGASGTVTIPAGSTRASFSVTVNGDTDIEPDEYLTVAIANVTGATYAPSSPLTGTIRNDDGPPLSVYSSSPDEGDTGTTTLMFDAYLPQPSSTPVTFSWATVDGTATAGSDYVTASGTVTIPAGQTRASFSVTVNGDTDIEPDEYLTVAIANVTGATYAPSSLLTGTIRNDDGPPPLYVYSSSPDEGDTGTTTLSFDAELDHASASPVTFSWATVDGTATAGSDYVTASGTVTIPAGSTWASFSVTVNGDTDIEPDEYLTVAIANVTGATYAPSSPPSGTIRDDDEPPPLSVYSSSSYEGDTGTRTLSYSAYLDHPSSTPVTFSWTTVDGTATADSDYVAASGTVTIPAGQTSASFSVTVNGDTDIEPDEYLTIAIANVTGATYAPSSPPSGRIWNDDGPLQLTVYGSSPSPYEGDTGTTTLSFDAELSHPSSTPVTFSWTTVDGTATAPSDYVAASGTVTIPAGSTWASFSVTVNGDTDIEPDEYLTVAIANVTGATYDAANSWPYGGIRNDDPTLTIDGYGTLEGDSDAGQQVVYDVYLSRPSTTPVAFDYATLDDTAQAPSDYVAKSGTATFNPGDTHIEIYVTVHGDTIVEADERFMLELWNVSGAKYQARQSDPKGWIRNDDTGLPALSVADLSVGEAADQAVFTLSLDAPSGLPASVDWATVDGSATAPSDYVAASGTVTIPAGQTAASLGPAQRRHALRARRVVRRGALLTALRHGRRRLRPGHHHQRRRPAGHQHRRPHRRRGRRRHERRGLQPQPLRAQRPARERRLGDRRWQRHRSLRLRRRERHGHHPRGPDRRESLGPLTATRSTSSTSRSAWCSPHRATPRSPTAPAWAPSPTTTTRRPSASTTPPSRRVTPARPTCLHLSLSAPSGLPASVDWATVDGSATAPSDYVAASGTVTIPAGQTAASLSVPLSGDTLYELDESFGVVLSSPRYATVADGSGLGTITNDDDPPAISIDDPTVAEGDAGTSDAVFSLSLSAPSGLPASVDWATVDGSATAPSDYVAASGTVTIPAGQTAASLSVPLSGDTLYELDESFGVVLSSPRYATVADGSGLGTITNDDDPPAISIDDPTVAEGDAGTSDAVFSLSLSAPSGLPASVDWATVDGSATAPSDYVAASGTVTIPAGQTAASLSVPLSGDTLYELDESFGVVLSSPRYATVADGSGLGTITNDDDPPAISIDDPTVAEGDAGTSDAVFSLSLSAPSGLPASVDWATVDGSATAPSDYVAASGTVTIPAGQTAASLSVPLSGDTLYELDESFGVVLSSPRYATVADGSGLGTITNDDDPPAISIDDPSVAEGDAGTTDLVYTLSLSAPSGLPASVDWATVDGSATAPSDYVAASGTVTIPAGATSATATVAVNGDTAIESDESFDLVLSNPIDASIADGTGLGTITNDDEPALALADASVTEGDDGTAILRFTPTLSETFYEDVTFDWRTQNGSATAGSDHVGVLSTPVTIPAGSLSTALEVTVNGDTLYEADESFWVVTSSLVNATYAQDDTAIGTITNDDDPPTISIDDPTVAEGDAGPTDLVFTLSLGAPSGLPASVDWATVDGSATAPSDYVAASGTVTIPAGATSATATVAVNGDTAIELDESFDLVLSDPIYATIADDTGTGTITNDDEPAGLPTAPRNVSVWVSGTSVAISWSAPLETGGAPISGYTATITPGGASCSTIRDLGCTVAGLADGIYSVTVSARNAIGTGPELTPIDFSVSTTNSSPQASLDVSPTSGPAPLDVSATVTGSDTDADVLTYTLDFGDGTSVASGSLPAAPTAHRYDRAGTYTVRLGVSDGHATTVETTTVTVWSSEPLQAVAGDDVSVTVGVPVTFDGSASRPQLGIGGYTWDFGDGSPSVDGARATHAFAEPGTYTVTLRVDRGGESSSATLTATVNAVPSVPGLSITVKESGGSTISAADVVVISANGTKYASTSGADGIARIDRLSDGNHTVYGWRSGYLPKAVEAVVVDGSGQIDLVLESGAVAQTELISRPLTAQEVLAAGIDPYDPGNQHVYEFEIHLAFRAQEATFTGYATSGNGFYGVGWGGGSGSCGTYCWSIGGYYVYPTLTYVSDQPSIIWMVIPGEAKWLKEFYEVRLIVSNLASPLFTFQNGKATLGELPSGLSLAPTAAPQSLLQDVPDIAGGESQAVSWIVRGDVEGFYTLGARYTGTLEPIGSAFTLNAATSPDALHVWGASAIEMIVDTDDQATKGYPYRVKVGLKNVADVPVYNAAVKLLESGGPNYIYQPKERFSQGTAAILPGDTFWTDWYRLIPDFSGTLDLSQSFVKQVPGTIDVASTIVSHPAVPIDDVPTVDVVGAIDGRRVTWDAIEGAEHYEVYTTPTRLAPFAAAPTLTVFPPDAELGVVLDEGGYVAVSTVRNGKNELLHPLTPVGYGLLPTANNPPGDQAEGPWYGGNSVTITGTELDDATVKVIHPDFGDLKAVVTSNSSTSLTFTVPKLPKPKAKAAQVDVLITTPGGTAQPLAYTYRGLLVVSLRGWLSAWDDTQFKFVTDLTGAGWPEDVFGLFNYDANVPHFDVPYGKCQTLAPLHDSVALLDEEIRNWVKRGHDPIDVYLVGHSQGGILAFGYLAYLNHIDPDRPYKDPMPGVTLQGVVTLDAPIGGVDGKSAFLAAVWSELERLKCLWDGPVPASVRDIRALGVQNEQELLDPWTWGAEASLAKTLWDVSSGPSNQQLAEAAGAAGVTVLTIGNLKDMSFATAGLFTTQFLRDGAVGSGVYAREFDTWAPLFDCGSDRSCLAGHRVVREHASVQEAIKALLSGTSWAEGDLKPPTRWSPLEKLLLVGTELSNVYLGATSGGLLLVSGHVLADTVVTLQPYVGSMLRDLELPPGLEISGAPHQVDGLASISNLVAELTLPYGPRLEDLSQILYRLDPLVPAQTMAAAGSPSAFVVASTQAGAVALTPMPTSADVTAGTLSADIDGDGIYVPMAVHPPVLAAPDSATTASDLTYTIRFAVPVTGLAANGFALAGSAIGCIVEEPVAIDDVSWNVPVTGCSSGTLTAALKAGSVVDEAGNRMPAADIEAPSLTITAKPTLTATVSVEAKPYDGSTTATVSGCTLSGVLDGDDVGCDPTAASAAFSDPGAGQWDVTAAGLTLIGADAPAYAFDGTGSGSGTIDPAGLMVTPDDQAITAGSAVPDAGFYTFELSGFVNDETAADAAGYLAPTCTSAYTTTTPASPPTLPITCSGGSAANYTFDTSASASLTITAKPALTATVSVETKPYDGSTTATLSGCTLSGVLDGDDVGCDSSAASAAFADPGAGQWDVTAAGLTLIGADAPAYAFDGTGSGSGTIDPAGLTVTPDDQAITAGSAVPDAGFYTFELSGFVNDETAGDAAGYLAPTCTSAYTTTTPASPPTLPITCSGGSAVNYTFDTSATASLTITAYVDSVAPILTVPADLTAEATGPTGAVVTFSASATDDTDPEPDVSCVPASGSTFALGDTTVSCTASDAATPPNTDTKSFTVSVIDTTPPTVTVPADQVVPAESPSGAHVTFDVTASDLVDGALTPTCSAASGDLFPVGETTVTCTATDAAGKTGSASFKVTVQTYVDSVAPILTVPADLTAEATGPTGAVVTFSASATDDTDPEPDVSCVPASGSTFALGDTTVSCTASDAATPPNTDTKSFTVSVIDTTPPTVTVPADQVVPAESPSGAHVTFDVTASDLVDGALTPTCSAASGDLFPVGETTVTCTATDAAGKTGSASFKVTVQTYVDSVAPILTVPADLTAEATGPTGAVVTFSASATDDTDPEPDVSCVPASGSTFALGDTTVSCTASDAATPPNTDTKSFTVSVIDTTPPTVTVPADQVVPAESPSGAHVTFDVTASDLVDGALTPTCSAASGDLFPVGETTVTCTATDAAGKTGSASFKVTVQTYVDSVAPILTVPADLTAEATGPTGAVVTFSASATDDTDPEPDVSCVPASGSTFALGDTTVSCTASDAATPPNTDTKSFTVSVIDTTPPTVTVPADQVVPAESPSGAHVTFDVTASDLVDGALTPTCSAASGDLFPVGETTVTCTATDAAGKTGSASFKVTVQTYVDSVAPILTVPADLTAEATGPTGAVVTFSASATDDTDPEPDVSCVPASGSTFALGDTTVSCTASDAATPPNTDTKSFTVSVIDTTPPTVTVPADQVVPAESPSGAHVTFDVTASDLVDGALTPTCSAASGDLFPVGETTVTCTATDAAGKTGSASFKVTVQTYVDNRAPSLSLPAPITTEAVGPSGAPVAYTATAADPETGALIPTCDPTSGSTFRLGATTVTCSVTDAAGFITTGSFTVTVVDTTAPVISVPGPMTAQSSSPGGTTLTYSASASDIVDGAISPACTPASGSTFPIGTTTISCTAADSRGNSATASFTITVTDVPLEPQTKIVDDKSMAYNKAQPGWKRQKAGADGGSYWTTVQKTKAKHKATWSASLDAPGRYHVWVIFPKANATTRSARYTVLTSTGSVTRTVDQSRKGGQWVDLGTYEFGTLARVRLTDRTGERTSSGRRIVYDTVRFVPLFTAVAVTAVPAVVEPSIDDTPAPTTTPAPEPQPQVAPEPTQALTPESTPEPKPDPKPDRTPEVKPEPTPEAKLDRTPEPTPDPTPDPTPAPTPENQSPRADAGGPYEVREGDTVTLDGSGSVDPDGDIVAYAWTREDRLDDASKVRPDFRARDDGELDIRLTVTDDAGATDTATTTIRIRNADPRLPELEPRTISAGETLALGLAFADPGPADSHTVTIDWGDGSTDQATVSEDQGEGTAVARHAYPQPVTTASPSPSATTTGAASAGPSRSRWPNHRHRSLHHHRRTRHPYRPSRRRPPRAPRWQRPR